VPASARRDIVDDHRVGVYHCIACCAQRAFLCGIDSYTGRDYSYRKAWVLDRLRHLAGLFGIELLFEWTGRELRRDKGGAIPADLAPILDRLGVDRSNWVQTVREPAVELKRGSARSSNVARPRESCGDTSNMEAKALNIRSRRPRRSEKVRR
jgi:hypothetical protein